MAQIHNSDLFKEVKDGAKIQQSFDAIPSQLAEKVVPVMEVNPKLLRRCNFMASAVRSTSGASTLVTTASDRDTFITNAYISTNYDNTAVVTVNRLTIVQDGATKVLILSPNTANFYLASAININLPFPLKVDRNSAIILGVTSSAGAYSISAGVVGYTVENINA